MAGLHPFARIIDLEKDIILASTDNLLDYELEWGLDRVGRLMIEVGAGDAGDGSTQSFAAALLEAAADLGSAPKPLLLEFSLDGGASFDSRKVVEQPERTLVASRRAIKEDGADLGSALSTIPCERVTFTDCRLADVFNGDAGTIVPGSGAGGIVPGAIPSLHGLLTVTPGRSGWSGAYRLKWTAVVAPSIQDTPTNVDVDAATTLAACETIVNRLAGAAPDQRYGHYVADPSDGALNLGGQSNAFVVGNVGTSPLLTFEATDSTDVDETRVARVHTDAATIKTDDSLLYPVCNFVGGKSTAGFPDGAKVTALALWNGTSATMSSAKDDWRDGVPLIGINVNDATGGVYFTILDGVIRPVPGSPATACQSLGVDLGGSGTWGTRHSALLMGSPHGVYIAQALDLNTGGATWSLLGDLNANVVRLNIEINTADPKYRVVYALVKGSGERTDGVYRWTDPASTYSYGTTGWQTVLQNTNVVDALATDYQQFWAVLSKPQDTLGRYAVSAGRGDLEQSYTLPAGGQIQHLQEIVTVSPAKDSVWVLVAGASTGSPAYYLLNSGDNFATDGAGHTLSFTDANQDSSLVGPGGTALQLNRVVGPGISFAGTTSSTLVNVFAATDQGGYFSTAALGGDLGWKSLNDQGGLANYNLKNIAVPEGQYIVGQAVNRLYATTEDDLLYSNSAGRWWQTIKGRDRTDAGPHLSVITLAIENANGTTPAPTGQTLPFSRVRTWGSTNWDGSIMTTSPLGAADNTHVLVPASLASEHHAVDNQDAVPQGYYWLRYLDQHLGYQYALVAQEEVCPFTGTQMSQLPELQTNASVDANMASKAVMMVARRWLQQHAVAQTQLVIRSSFATREAALRRVRPSMQVYVNGQITLVDVSTSGTALSTTVWDAENAPFYVLTHSMKKSAGLVAETTTTLGTQLFTTPPSESDIMNASQDEIRAVKVWR